MMSTTAASGGSAGGPLGPWADGFAGWLSAQGYTPETIAGYLGWLSGWLAGQGLAAGALTEARAARFAASMRAAGHPKITPGLLAIMLCYLREAGAVPVEGASPSTGTPRQQLLAAYGPRAGCSRAWPARRGCGPAHRGPVRCSGHSGTPSPSARWSAGTRTAPTSMPA